MEKDFLKDCLNLNPIFLNELQTIKLNKIFLTVCFNYLQQCRFIDMYYESQKHMNIIGKF